MNKDEQILALMPWYVNGTLSDDEQAQVQDLLERSSEARAELDFLRTLQRQIRQEPLAAPSEIGWRRLQREITPRQGEQRRWYQPLMAAAAMLVIALQLTLLFRSDPEPVELLGSHPSLAVEDAWVVQLRFQEDADWIAVMTLLTEMDARLVDGPSSLGLVRVAVAREGGAFGDADSALNWLRGQSIVEHAALEPGQ